MREQVWTYSQASQRNFQHNYFLNMWCVTLVTNCLDRTSSRNV